MGTTFPKDIMDCMKGFKTTPRNSGLQNKAGKTKTRRTGKKAERYQH